MGNCIATPRKHGGDRSLPPEVGETFTCVICTEPTERVAQTFRPKNATCAAHDFCNDCMIKYIEAKLDDSIPKIPCPAPTCPEFLDPLEYRVLVGKRLFVRWCDALCELSLLKLERSQCPNRKCSAVVVNECGGAAVKKAACPSCKTAFCFQCGLTWHSGFNCEEVMDPNDAAFVRLVKRRKWKRCPHCRHFVQRSKGCPVMHCRCRISFCYDCGERIELCRCKISTACLIVAFIFACVQCQLHCRRR